jgi:hypothetical protein
MRRTSIEQLPIWPEPVRGAPNALLRSAFFAGIHSKKRRRLGIEISPQDEPEGVVIAAVHGVTIKYAGTQLNQYDADVFFEALHQARRSPLETECFFKGRGFLEAIGRSDSALSYEDLDQSLRRLQRGTVDIEFRLRGVPVAFTGSLISSYVREKESRLYKITFAKEISALFVPAAWTALELDERHALKGKPLAQWLHSYYSTHAAPYPVTVAFLKEKTGSPTTKLFHFKAELKVALKALHDTLGWETTWDGDLVTLTKPPSDAQGRHLTRRAERKHLVAQKARKEAKERREAIGMTAIADMLPDLFKTLPRKR